MQFWPDNAKIQRMGCHLLHKIVVPGPCSYATHSPRTNLTRCTLGGAVALLCTAARVQPNTVQTLREAAARHPNDAALQTHVRLTLERLGAR